MPKPEMPMLTGERVQLEPATVGHAPALLAAMHPDAAKNLQFFSTPADLDREVAYLQRMITNEHDFLYVVTARSTGSVLGTIGIHEFDLYHRTARFGVLIFNTADRGRGHGSAAIRLLLRFAFETLGVNKVYGKVFARNIRGRTLYARLGFLQEGVLRQEYLLDDRFHDMVYISMLREDWDALNRKEGSA